MIIYAVIKKSTDEIVYIGQTIQTLYKRRSKHLSDSRKGKGSVLGAAIRKHTINNFKFIELESCGTQAQLCAAERYLIHTFKPKYNVQEGGKKSFTPWNKGKKETRPQVIENISKSAKIRKSTKRGKYRKSHVQNIKRAKLKSVEREFKCLENEKVYKNKVEAAQDLGIKAGGISAVLSNKTRNKTIHGYTFVYLNHKGN